MIQLNKLFLFVIAVLLPLKLLSQNLFDEPNVLKFANFLYSSHQYKFASEEFERLVVLVPGNTNYQLSLVRSYRLSENYNQAEKRLSDFAGDSLHFLTSPLGTEYLKIKILQENYKDVQRYLNINNRLNFGIKAQYQEYLYLLDRNWAKADSFNRQNRPLDTRYEQLLAEAGKIRYKSPALSGVLSTAVPGIGKVYSGYWKDGVIALLFVSANAWQSYRGFSKFGVHNATGWVFGSLAAGFYLGNIYGSIKAAVKHNRNANDKIFKRAKVFIISDIQ